MTAIPYSTFQKDFKFQRLLGKGNCATVSQVQHLIDRQRYALKLITVPNHEQLSHSFNEIQVIRLIDDDRATKIYYYYTHHNQLNGNFQLGLIMELCGSNLTELMKLRKKKSPTITYFSVFQLKELLGCLVPFFAKMQTKKVLHRDIKPDNILLAKTRKTEYRVADFGFSIKLNAYSQCNIAGTMEYVSPKLAPKFKDHKKSVPGHTIKDDVYSFGKTLGEFMTLENGPDITSKKIIQCIQRYGKQYTNVLMMTTKQSQSERIDFVSLEQHLIQNNLIDIPESILDKTLNASIDKNASMNSQDFQKERQKSFNAYSNDRRKTKSPNSTKVKGKKTPPCRTTLSKNDSHGPQRSRKQYPKLSPNKKWQKKVINLKEQVSCLAVWDNLLFLGMEEKLGIMILPTQRLLKFSHGDSLKGITCLKVAPESQNLIIGTLRNKLFCLSVAQLKRLIFNNTDSYRSKTSLILPIENLKCMQYTLNAPISALDFYHQNNLQPTIITAHYTGEVTVIASNKIQRRITFLTEPITDIQIRDGVIYTSSAHGMFKRQSARSLGVNVKEQSSDRVLDIKNNQYYKCDEAILAFQIVSRCKRNQFIQKEQYQYLAILACYDGKLYIVSKAMKCEKMIRISECNLLSAHFKPKIDHQLGVEGQFINEEGVFILDDGFSTHKLEQKNLVCLVTNNTNVYCGGFDKNLIVLTQQNVSVDLEQ